MSKDILADLTEEWYSEPDKQAETTEEVLDDELLEMHVLLKSRGTVFAGDGSVTVSEIEEKNIKK